MIPELLTNKKAFQPTLSDSVDFTQRYGFLYVGAAGNVKVHTLGGDDVTFNSVPAGTVLGGSMPLKITRVWSTGTTVAASNLLVMHSE